MFSYFHPTIVEYLAWPIPRNLNFWPENRVLLPVQQLIIAKWVTVTAQGFLLADLFSNRFCISVDSLHLPSLVLKIAHTPLTPTVRRPEELWSSPNIFYCGSRSLQDSQHVSWCLRTLSFLPLNFFGGLLRSPAPGWTTQRSSTKLFKIRPRQNIITHRVQNTHLTKTTE